VRKVSPRTYIKCTKEGGGGGSGWGVGEGGRWEGGKVERNREGVSGGAGAEEVGRGRKEQEWTGGGKKVAQ